VAKIFVGGLGPHTTAESLRQHFSRFGTITDSSVVNKPGANESRGFGFVEFENGIPTVVLEKQHIVDNRRCSVRAYNYSPA
jgi:RNA-binding protein Musashi